MAPDVAGSVLEHAGTHFTDPYDSLAGCQLATSNLL